MFLFALFGLLFIVTFFSLAYFDEERDRKFAISFSILFVIIGTIRWKMGGDWGTYYRFFGYIRISNFPPVAYEPLFTLCYIIAKYTLNSFIVVQFIQVLTCVYFKYKGFKRYSNHLMLATFLNYCFYLSDMFTVRNYFAAAIAFWGCKYVEDKKPFKFVLCVLLASNIHMSTILVLVAYPLWHARISIWTKSIFLISSIILGLSGLFTTIVSKSAIFLALFSEQAAYKLDYYDQIGDVNADKEGSGMILLLGIIKRLIFIPIIFYFEKTTYSNDKRYKALTTLFIFGNFIYFLTLDFKIFQRLSIPFYIFEIPILIYIYQKSKFNLTFLLILGVYGLSKVIVGIDIRDLYQFVTIFNTSATTYWDKFDRGVW
jgi:hypothetical protein